MASICREIVISRPASQVWDAIRDVGSVEKRLAPGFVRECRLEGEARVIAFANGLVVRELIVALDDAARRLAYSARSDRLEHHNACFQVLDEGPEKSRLVWLADVLPHEAAKPVAEMMEQGAAVMKRTLEAAP